MKTRVTIYQLAEKVGVSPSTVNRALNGKINVKPEVKARILQAAQEMGYKYNTVAASLSREPIKVSAVLYSSVFAFSNDVEDGMRKAMDQLADRNLEGEIIRLPRECSAQEYTDKVKELAQQGRDALILLPHRDEDAMSALLGYLEEKGIAVGIVISDISGTNRVISLRRNGTLCGGMAAELLGLLVGEKKQVAVLTGSSIGVVHTESTNAFMQVAAFKGLKVVGVYNHLDEPETASAFAQSILKSYPDLGGVYFNSANSISFCRTLLKMGKSKDIRVVTTDLFPELKEYVMNDTIDYTLFCNPYLQGKMVVECMFKHIAEHRNYNDGNILIDPQIVTKWNIDYFMQYNVKGDKDKNGELSDCHER